MLLSLFLFSHSRRAPHTCSVAFVASVAAAMALAGGSVQAQNLNEPQVRLDDVASISECTFQWEVKGRGITVGISHDTVRWGKASTSVVSLFTPSRMASMLGAPTVERKWFSSKNQGVQREENKYKGRAEPDKVRWVAKGDKLWQTVNQAAHQEFPAPAGVSARQYIDSTVFAYLDLVGQPLPAEPAKAWILNRQAPYQANTQRTAATVEYSAGNKRGIVWVSAGKPTKMSFSEGNDKFEARVVSTNCK